MLEEAHLRSLHRPRCVRDTATPQAGAARKGDTAKERSPEIIQAVALEEKLRLARHLTVRFWGPRYRPRHIQGCGAPTPGTAKAPGCCCVHLSAQFLWAAALDACEAIRQIEDGPRAQRWQHRATIQREEIDARDSCASSGFDICPHDDAYYSGDTRSSVRKGGRERRSYCAIKKVMLCDSVYQPQGNRKSDENKWKLSRDSQWPCVPHKFV